MMKDIKKSERGITLITLAITIFIMVIITATIARDSYDSTQLSKITKLDNDITALNDRIAAYYIEHETLPTIGAPFDKEILAEGIGDLSVNDGTDYYTIDLEKLDNLTLNYGGDYQDEDSLNAYIVNAESHMIYYLQGVRYKGVTYHTVGINAEVELEI